jgi:hypothetical protein
VEKLWMARANPVENPTVKINLPAAMPLQQLRGVIVDGAFAISFA